MGNYRFLEALKETQITELVELYKNEFWSHHRQREEVVKMLGSTDVIIGIVDDRDRLLAFTRVLTDFVYRGIIFDVIVKPTHRKMGMGAQLMDAIINHPKLRSVEYIGLYCLPQMFPFYERWGFTADTGGIQLMMRKQETSPVEGDVSRDERA